MAGKNEKKTPDVSRVGVLALTRKLSAEDRAWLAARLLEAEDVDDGSDAYHLHFEALFDLVDAKVTPDLVRGDDE